MVRHENDLDFVLPVILYASNPIVFIWGVFNKDDFRLNILRERGVNPTFLDGVYKSLLDRLRLKILKNINRSLYVKNIKSINKKQQRLMLNSLESHLRNIDFGSVNNIVFDHTVNLTVELMINIFKKWNVNSKILSLPHSYSVVTNKLTKYSLINPSSIKHNWDIFDYIVSFNDNQSDFFDSVNKDKKIVIPSLRNTIQWVDFLLDRFSIDKNTSVKKNNKIKFLIIHNRLESNINKEELIRSIKILDQFECFDIRVKPHPRRVLDGIALTKLSESVSLIQKHIVECVYWSDFVLFFHSSAVYDALLLNKPILHSKCISSNKIDEAVLEYCHVLYTPDDFYSIIEEIVSGNVIFPPNHCSPSWSILIDQWAELIN